MKHLAEIALELVVNNLEIRHGLVGRIFVLVLLEQLGILSQLGPRFGRLELFKPKNTFNKWPPRSTNPQTRCPTSFDEIDRCLRMKTLEHLGAERLLMWIVRRLVRSCW